MLGIESERDFYFCIFHLLPLSFGFIFGFVFRAFSGTDITPVGPLPLPEEKGEEVGPKNLPLPNPHPIAIPDPLD